MRLANLHNNTLQALSSTLSLHMAAQAVTQTPINSFKSRLGLHNLLYDIPGCQHFFFMLHFTTIKTSLQLDHNN